MEITVSPRTMRTLVVGVVAFCVLGAAVARSAWAHCGDQPNPYYCYSTGGGAEMSDQKCQLPVANSGCGTCVCAWSVPACEFTLPRCVTLMVDQGTTQCCMDFNNNECCHQAMVDWATWENQWYCGDLANETSTGTCPPTSAITNGQAIYPPDPCNGTSPECDD